ncbi:MAG: hypothetical protein Fues2KO_01560 [Fuerstiella sp.]
MPGSDASTVQLYRSLRAGRESAAEQIYLRFQERLIRLARSRLSPALARRIDPEDVVQSAYRSFFVASREDRFQINESGQLWSLLVTLTLRKVARTAAVHTASRRSVQVEVDLSDFGAIAQEPDRQHDAEHAVALADEVCRLLRSLSPRDRRIVELYLQGESKAAIAAELHLSERSVRRVLRQVRQSAELRNQELARQPARSSVRARKARIADADLQLPTSDDQLSDVELLAVATPEETERHWRKAVEQGLTVFPFSDLRLLRMIGRGGVGKVFEAQHLSSGRTVAVKFLHRRFQNDAGAVHRLLNEADTIRKLKHQGVVRWLGIGRTRGGVIFLVLDFVAGQSLDQIAEPLQVSEVVSIGHSLAQTLRYIHQRGVIHCDLKPSNVIVRADGAPVLADFGLARSVVSHDADLHEIAGTAPWMAPEQIDAHFGPLTAQTDVYGFGALMYSLLCGRPPYDGARAADIFAKIIGGHSYASIQSLNPQVPDGLQQLIVDCLNREAQRRSASFADVAERLEKLASD